MPAIYFDDLEPGSVTTYGAKRVEADEITAFARLYDPQPFHLGEAEARGTFPGRLVASGWHSVAMQMRMLCDAWLLDAAGMGSPGIDELRWLKPVLPGALLSTRQTVLGRKASRSRPEMGLVWYRLELIDADGTTLMTMRNPVMFARRDPAAPPPVDVIPDLPPPSRGPDGPEEAQHLGAHTFSAPEIVAFASAYDPQPFHLSEEAAARGPFGRLAASGWHTAALWMRGFVDNRERRARAAEAAGRVPVEYGPSPGISDLRWLRPVFAGDTIRFATAVTGRVPSPFRAGWALEFCTNTGVNGAGETVLSFRASSFVRLDPAGPAA